MNTKNRHIKKGIFKTIAILLPFFILLLIEGFLQLFSYGYNTDLFIEDHTRQYYYLNPEISKKYFTISENATQGNRELFPKKKETNTKRFFVLGASSSVGYPYMHNGAFPRILKYKLQFAYPDINFEIINLSLTAVNSYTLYDFSKQLTQYEPDGILIYAGHNEYYGALGVASSSRLGRNPQWVKTTLALKDYKLGQWIFKLAAQIKRTDKKTTDYTLTLMERMAQDQSVPYNSELFHSGIRQFDTNIRNLLELFNKSNTPVYISNLVYNQKDLKPFISSTDKFNAQHYYEKGSNAYEQEKYNEAKEYFIQAKDYDELRFRAPGQINELISQYANEQENVYLIDAIETFEKHSPHGIIDETLLLEHVHPNLKGQQLLAEEFYKAIIETQSLPTSKMSNSTYEVSHEEYPFTLYDNFFGRISIWLLKELWPFNEPIPDEDPDHERSWPEQVAGATAVRQINWLQAMNYLYDYYKKENDTENMLRIIEGLCLEYPYDISYYQQASELSSQTGQKEKADFYQIKAKQLKEKI